MAGSKRSSPPTTTWTPTSTPRSRVHRDGAGERCISVDRSASGSGPRRERLRAGAEITWSERHGDQAVVVVEGSVRVGEGGCGADGVVIIEPAAPATLVVVEDAELLHYGDESQAAHTDSPTVHVVGAEGHGSFEDPSAPGPGSTFYVDSSCRGCDITLFRVWSEREYVGSPHSHSVDELIHVTRRHLDRRAGARRGHDHRHPGGPHVHVPRRGRVSALQLPSCRVADDPRPVEAGSQETRAACVTTTGGRSSPGRAWCRGTHAARRSCRRGSRSRSSTRSRRSSRLPSPRGL